MTKKLLIEGMTCAHCVKHVEDALNELDGVKSAKANLEGKNAVVEFNKDISDDILKETIEEVGYELVEILAV
ncbi:MAG: heavy-metal-associated domain-containing protein [Clostridiales bacterium]|jgi:copper ion binding protein|nr:heavy-metal-associated domain-containing protein [Clostridiales bacterium]